ncbi:MAG: hypothetical protein M1834_007100 [Cirrosporium novae-zelandiae]|nr:MAG: hypothetical protein M1834_007100 [Cirrosporium novae-zelandiae]
MSFGPAPEPKSLLGRHRLLSPSANVRVSPICLGSMGFGTNWTAIMGETTETTARSIMDHFYDNGGNFIDTSNNYQDTQSETWIGQWMKDRGNRDEIVLATKFGSAYERDGNPMKSNLGGNTAKALHISVESSLKRLQTGYIDVLYVHWWDYTANIPELMQSLNDMVRLGKVLYLGISDTPAWVVSKANQYARDHGLHQFVIYQGLWNAAKRDFERDIIPMALDEGMALAPWGSLGSGNFKRVGEAQTRHPDAFPPSKADIAVSAALTKIADAKDVDLTAVAMAYVMQKTPYVFPIIGCRKLSHLEGNIKALGLELSDEDISEIENANEFDVGFPQTFAKLGLNAGAVKSPGDVFLTQMAGRFDFVEGPKAIRPHKK